MATQIHIEIPELALFEERFASLPANIKAEIKLSLARSAILIQTLAKEEAPVRTGHLRSMIDFVVEDTRAVVRANASYSDWVHRGTGVWGPNRQAITPKTRNVLATKTNPGWGSPNSRGYYIIGRSSQGQKPNPFMERAKNRGQAEVKKEFKVMTSRIVQGLKVN